MVELNEIKSNCDGRIFGCKCHVFSISNNMKQSNCESAELERKDLKNIFHNKLLEKPDKVRKSNFEMLIRCFKSVRRQSLLVFVVISVFILGTAIPYIWNRVQLNTQSPEPQLTPIHIYTNSVLRPDLLDIHGAEPVSAVQSLSLSLAPVQHFINNIFISVKTTKKYHYPRLIILLETWASLLREQTWFFTDYESPEGEDKYLKNRTGNHLVYTNCSTDHYRLSLCCKMAAEFEYFLKSHKSWWCHMDDDNYLNPLALVHLLKRFDPGDPVYLGRTSTATPLQIVDIQGTKNTTFWFATGGAGFCVSRVLALKMAPHAGDRQFVESGNQFWFPDDVTLGYIIDTKLGIHLTEVPEFHSHLEHLNNLQQSNLETSVTLSYSGVETGQKTSFTYQDTRTQDTDRKQEDKIIANTVTIGGPFSRSVDPTRFYSVHCYLYGASYCP
ncbi:beta-1,3-N-acetylglucosaminyltransferase manic fringe [Eurytemora carolleeae]|uniref:beta-1,3-N-acetylglucosaminyltransferase manic fringe n=1 Tax=Eurytemora carolleeae TaxID=1294199 RepID=UPI000C77BCEC|nr:beta-1,3-N-acetylglucosaminyltransferase manic fringe [Eurytemora carolleeae]|eukprot:XP_023331863.1 beta-1,3-N-acetylglucosaminyltransferase manic fringe-like [Eurytemora affinis]